MVKRKNKCFYQVEYFDPEYPEGEKWKTWKSKSKKELKKIQEDLKVIWDEPIKSFPIKKVCPIPIKNKKYAYSGTVEGFIKWGEKELEKAKKAKKHLSQVGMKGSTR